MENVLICIKVHLICEIQRGKISDTKRVESKTKYEEQKGSKSQREMWKIENDNFNV